MCIRDSLGDGRILCIRLKRGQMQSTVTVGTVGVFSVEPVSYTHLQGKTDKAVLIGKNNKVQYL